MCHRALSEEQIEILADKYIIGLYQQMEDEVIADIARRVKATGRYTETAEIMAKDMIEQGYSADKIRTAVMQSIRADKDYQMAVAENTLKAKQEIQDIIDKTVAKAKGQGKELIAQAGSMAWNNDLSMWEEQGEDLKQPNSMSQLIKAAQKQTVGELKNLTRSMGFKNVLLGTTGVKGMYQREMDLALLKVCTGTFSYDAAVDECIHRMAQSGLRTIDYASGKSYQLDTAARMCVRTGMSQLSGKITEANLQQSDHDLVITSQHMGSRPEHAVWQNKVFSYSGKSKKYPDFVKETGYGTVTGLKGANCTHDFYPYWEGASVVPDNVTAPEPKVIDGKKYTYYQMTQQQRKMERQIRATKREIEAQNIVGGDVTVLKNKLSRQMDQYVSFSDKAELRPKENRLRIIAGTSVMPNVKNWPKKALMEAPQILDKRMREERKKLQTYLGNSKKEDMMTLRFIMSSETVRYIEDKELRVPFAYLPSDDIIKYNTQAPDFEQYDLLFAQIHELSHRIDYKELQSWKNKRFVSAIQKAEQTILMKNDTIIEWFSSGGRYEKDMAFSDIISALSQGSMNQYLIAGHRAEYWKNNPDIQKMEIFANIASIDILDLTSKMELQDIFSDLYTAYKEIIK